MSSRTKKPVVTGCVLIIGNEILSGRTQDTNLAYLARELNELGVQLTEARVIPDVEDVIVAAVNECRAEFDYVFTTGGIGPTHDDITADCIAKAFGVELEMHPEAVAIIKRREAPPEIMESRLRMARVPKGGVLIDNPTYGPPGFQMENVFVMAGVPVVMQAMVSTLGDGRIVGGDPVRSRSIGAYLAESQVAVRLREIQGRYEDVDLGSYPFYRDDGYGTNLVMRGTDEGELERMKGEIREMIVEFGGEPIED
ncbi:MAG: molybdopterin-binding protein [Pseudomonadales bacterium]|jgi:molybdenum cofactor synthesis domain-containing protein|nr:molybdopterin-binding protein [Pseudomonadales bacterium]HJN52854.1 molybdopterin-binding protein [Pseudomonadales bacterium]|tara:strand:+ start:640 stop:1401 length:762 start_codon:yes stop_codon:yes gene_type:complete